MWPGPKGRLTRQVRSSVSSHQSLVSSCRICSACWENTSSRASACGDFSSLTTGLAPEEQTKIVRAMANELAARGITYLLFGHRLTVHHGYYGCRVAGARLVGSAWVRLRYQAGRITTGVRDA